MQKILVLGHKGMLGNAVYSYLSQSNTYEIVTTSERFGAESFVESLKTIDADVIINCIGLIPQKNPPSSEYRKVNVELPVFLETLGKKIIQPSTDCEFLGNISPDSKYKKESPRDADDEYGMSKAKISQLIETSFTNTKVIRTSIIGHELQTHLSLLDWFLHAEGTVNGYTNHYWNGITTLQWAKLCEQIILNWGTHPIINQYGTDKVASKYELLETIKEVYEKDITIIPLQVPQTVNKCLESDISLSDIKVQLTELKTFYRK